MKLTYKPCLYISVDTHIFIPLNVLKIAAMYSKYHSCMHYGYTCLWLIIITHEQQRSLLA